jgi:superfamily I DNA/RNA helicase/mRNA-degrading endonuclease RelE of RelBE toxin-antitoxin system
MQPKVAISSEFFTSVLKLPKSQQEKAVKFMEQFRQNPTSSAINYEKILNARDKNLRSVRIDLAYRAIVLAPEKGDVYILLWADNHDDAYEWACNKILKINPENGVLQVLDAKYIDEASLLQNDATSSLFDKIKGKHLIRLGVPEELLPLLRTIKIPSDIENIRDKIPEEAYEALALIADGFSFEEVLSVYDMDLHNTTSRIDVEDFVSALDKPYSKKMFLLASDDEALQAMLDAPLEKWRVFLHPLQQQLVSKDWTGAVRVLGGAGTGKTVVAIHRAKWLAERLPKSSDFKILFTTYTKNLASDIEQNLKHICSPEILRKIEVINLDAWVKRFMEKQGYAVHFAFDEQVKKGIWEKALLLKPSVAELPDSFYFEEWAKVIQPQNITSLEKYFKARRLGRGTQISRTLRKQVWDVFEHYRLGLSDLDLKEVEDVYRDAIGLIQEKFIQLPYSSVIVDEAQDFGSNAFRLIRELVPEQKNDLFIVGDAHQRIYGSHVVLGQCGIKVIGRSKKLRLNYRTTEQIRNWATSVLSNHQFDDLDAGLDDQKGYRSVMTGDKPAIHCFDTEDEEKAFIIESLNKFTEAELAKICITVRRNSDVDRYAKALLLNKIPYFKIDSNSTDSVSALGVRLSTMHRIKGLEFDYMYVAGVNEGVLPLSIIDSNDVTIIREYEKKERSLLYVAVTRAKRFCCISGFGKLSKFLYSL